MTAGYYRFPTIHNDTVVFVSEDDLWSVPSNGGLAHRLTSNLGDITHPVLSPDGEWLAFVGREEGAPEVYLMPAGGGSATRLTYLSSYCRIVGWDPTGRYILFASNYGQVVHSEYALYRMDIHARNGEVEPLPYGPARSIAFGPDGEIVLGRNTGDPARWKRYRGGTAGHMWIGKEGEFQPFLTELSGNIAAPMWISTQAGERIFFVSDHQGIGNLYSCTRDGADLRRHTDHEDYYVRNPSTDGKQIVYHAGADLYIYHVGEDCTTCIPVDYRSPRVQRNRKFVSSRRYLGDAALHPSGQVTTLVTRGKAYTFFNHEGPVLQHGVPNGVRYRQPLWFNDGRRLLLVSDEPGEETLEVHSTEPGVQPLQLVGLDIGRPVTMKMCPTTDRVAISNHRHELLIVDLDGLDVSSSAAAQAHYTNGTSHDPKPTETEQAPDYTARVTQVDRSPQRVIRGFDWSPDGRWLAYGFGATTHTTAIRLYRLADPDATEEALRTPLTHTVTQPVLHDMQPAFDPDGRFLYFLSSRDFNPVYDAMHFDLSFPWGMRPYLITLQADQPNPFVPRPDADDDWLDDEPEEEDAEEEDAEEEDDEDEESAAEDADEESDDEEFDEGLDEELDEESDDGDEVKATGGRIEAQENSPGAHEMQQSDATNGTSKSDGEKTEEPSGPPALRIDLDGIERRVLAFPVPDARYGQIAGVSGKALFTVLPVEGALDADDDWDDEEEESGSLRAYDFKELKTETLASEVSWFTLSRNRKKLLYFSGRHPRIIKAGEKAPSSSGSPRKSGWINMGRVKVSVDPPSEWQQMMREAWRLQRDYFWTEDMSQVDWQTVFLRYYPLIERVSSRSEFSDLMWEMQGELATSHAYEIGGDYRHGPYYGQGFLGADLRWSEKQGGYVVGEILRGDSWDRAANSPLADPGLDIQPGDVVVAINGQPLDAQTGPAQMLVNQADSEIMLTLLPRPDEAAEQDAAGNTEAQTEANSQTDSQRSHTPSTASHPGTPNADKPSVDETGAEKPAPPADAATPAILDSSQYRMTVVKTIHSETTIRYRAWVEANRARVHAATEGRVGYVHIPDMGAAGYAEFHRGYLAETDRDGLIVDVRYNGGGHVSQLILEKLARRRIGYDMPRWSSPIPYPMDSVAGPIVALTNEHASSDGDIFCHGFKLMGLGPLIGKRTWGGVIGISPRQSLVDGTITTQPEYSFWFEDVGWGVENYGTDPDIEVDITPQDYAAGRDPQLERAITEATLLLSTAVILKPDLNNRPKLPLPKLPPRF